MTSPVPFVDRKRMTYLGEAVARRLHAARRPLVEDGDIWAILVRIYAERSVSYLRGERPTADTLDRVKSLLKAERVLTRDIDYRRFWRVSALPDIDADDLVCLVDPGTCLSHLSAMQVFNLTERRPIPLYVTIANAAAWREMAHDVDGGEERGKPPIRHHHPATVRGRALIAMERRVFPPTTMLRGGSRRVTDIGQTFVDMLETPDRCGGMAHVLDVMARHAETYLNPIVAAIDRASTAVTKVRAGYILGERLGLRHDGIAAWTAFAQRGGSRRLDPQADYTPPFSDVWMLSINA